MSAKLAWALALAGATGAWGAERADAQADYPTRQIEVVVPFPAGGATDVIARMSSRIVSEKLGQPVVIQNKAGATGAIGSEYVAKAKPDGYTLLVATASTHAVLPAYRTDLPYDTVKSFSAEFARRQPAKGAVEDGPRIHRVSQEPAGQDQLCQFRFGQFPALRW